MRNCTGHSSTSGTLRLGEKELSYNKRWLQYMLQNHQGISTIMIVEIYAQIYKILIKICIQIKLISRFFVKRGLFSQSEVHPTW